MPLHTSRLGPGSHFAHSEEAARGKGAEAWGRGGGPRPGRVSGPAPGRVPGGWGRGLCAAAPGLQGRGRERAARAFPQARRTLRHRQEPRSSLARLSCETYAEGVGACPPHPGRGSTAARGAGPDVLAFAGLAALPAPNPPRHQSCLWEPAFLTRLSPYVIRIPSGELANILIHVL